MNKVYYLYLPVIGLALWSGILVIVPKLELPFWSDSLTQLLALLLFLGGSTLVTILYRHANRSQQQFRTLFENSPEGIAISDEYGNIQNLNASFEELFSYSRKEAVGSNLDELLTQTQAEKKHASRITDRLRDKNILREELIRYDKEGNAVPVLLSAIPVEQEGQVTSYFAIYIDIRRQKHLEERNRKLLERERTLRARAEKSKEQFQTMFEESPSAIALVEGSSHNFVYTNKTYRKIFGKDSEGRSVEEVFPEFRDQGLIDLLDQVYKTGEVHEGREEPLYVQKNGQEVEMYRDYVYKPLQDDKGQTYAIFIDSVDVTNKVEYRRQLQAELREKTTLLEEIHHRVKNNLASITGILQLQLHHITDDQAREALIDSELRIHTLADIHELLYESEKLSEIRMETYIKKLIDHISKVAGRGKKIDTKVDVQPFTLNVHQAQPLALMLNELIQNAYKHAFPDNESGCIQVSGEAEGRKVQLLIEDNGVGISDSEVNNGGLGMDLVKNIKQQLEADVEVQTEEGTRFYIEFEKQENNAG